MFLERFDSVGVTAEMLGVSYAMAENTFAVTQTEAVAVELSVGFDVDRPEVIGRVRRTAVAGCRRHSPDAVAEGLLRTSSIPGTSYSHSQ